MIFDDNLTLLPCSKTVNDSLLSVRQFFATSPPAPPAEDGRFKCLKRLSQLEEMYWVGAWDAAKRL